VLATARDAMAQAGVGADGIAAIGLTNQRETVVVWDRKTGEPVAPAIVWQDRRTADYVAALREAGQEPLVQNRAGLLLDPYFTASKLHWLLRDVPGAKQRAAAGDLAAGTIDAWLVWKLTGGRQHLTDVTNASRTMLMDIHRGEWDDDLLALFDIPRAVLPRIVPSSGDFGTTDPSLFGGAIPVRGAIGDQQSALFGQLCNEPGLVKCTYGTGCFMLLFTGSDAVASRNRLLTTVAWQIGGAPLQYALEGSVFVGGAAIQWLRDGLGIIRTAADVNDLAASVPDSGGVVVGPVGPRHHPRTHPRQHVGTHCAGDP
jgi:glycerol kinase